MVLRVCGVLALALGLFFWAGDLRELVGVHMLLGLLVVLALWLLSAAAAAAGLLPLGIAGLLLGLVVAWLGLTQSSLLPGANHAIVQIVHFLLGVAAVAFGEIVGGRLRRAMVAQSGA
jgi:hypothetical protein